MIKYLVSDLDGTLFKGHGDTVYDLTKENELGIKRAKAHGIHIIPCSGRSIPYTLKLYDKYSLNEDVWAGGLNGAVIYHHQVVREYTLNNADVLDMIELLKPYEDCYYNMQIQDMWDLRTYFNIHNDPVQLYKDESKTLGCCTVNDEEIVPYLKAHEDMHIGKFSVLSHTREQSNYLEGLVRAKYNEKYAITRSGERFLEVTHVEATKGNFVEYLHTTGIPYDEIAVIGDSYNDISMFDKTIHSFAMSNAEVPVQKSANYVVDDVWQAIDKLIEMNRKQAF